MVGSLATQPHQQWDREPKKSIGKADRMLTSFKSSWKANNAMNHQNTLTSILMLFRKEPATPTPKRGSSCPTQEMQPPGMLKASVFRRRKEPDAKDAERQ